MTYDDDDDDDNRFDLLSIYNHPSNNNKIINCYHHHHHYYCRLLFQVDISSHMIINIESIYKIAKTIVNERNIFQYVFFFPLLFMCFWPIFIFIYRYITLWWCIYPNYYQWLIVVVVVFIYKKNIEIQIDFTIKIVVIGLIHS